MTELRIFFSVPGLGKYLVLLCLLLSGFAAGLGIASLLPLLRVAKGEALDAGTPTDAAILEVLDFLGVAPDPVPLLFLIAGLITAKAGLMILAMTQVGYAVARVATDLRREMIEKLLTARWPYFLSQHGGRLANAISTEAMRSGSAVLQASLFISLVIQMTIYGAVALLVSWELGVGAVVIGGTIAFALSWLVRMARAAGRQQTLQNMELVSQLTDALGGIKPLKAMARQAHLEAFFSRTIDGLEVALRRETISKEALSKLQEPLLVAMLCGTLYLALQLLDTDFPQILVMGLLLQRTVNSMNKAHQQHQKTMVFESAYFAVRRIIDEAEANREIHSGKTAPSLDKEIEIRDLHFEYPNGKVIFDKASLEIEANRITVLSGQSGVGKTTLVDLILDLQRPRGGTILIDGVKLEELDMRAWRGMVGYVPQDPFLFNESVLENVRLGDEAIPESSVIEALKKADAWDFVARLPDGILSAVGEGGAKLSGGQRQRIALARALVQDPRLLILDEVTSALDSETEAAICRRIRELSGEMTIISITHRSAWLTLADRVYEITETGLYCLK